ncbi:hypothetical protein J4216_05985 [Candidatus Woesearchaeota archaeon]|nr:hypothetical protein [Candidatus Woesearchaeota archaeon]
MNNKYKIFTTEQFDLDFKDLDNSIKIQIEDEIEQLEKNPYVEKPLG